MVCHGALQSKGLLKKAACLSLHQITFLGFFFFLKKKTVNEAFTGGNKSLGIQTSPSVRAPLRISAVRVQWWLSEAPVLYKTQMLSGLA